MTTETTKAKSRSTDATPPPAQRAGYEVNEWCSIAGFGRALLYRLLGDGRGPRAVKIGRKTLIVETPAEFLARVGRPYGAEGVTK